MGLEQERHRSTGHGNPARVELARIAKMQVPGYSDDARKENIRRT